MQKKNINIYMNKLEVPSKPALEITACVVFIVGVLIQHLINLIVIKQLRRASQNLEDVIEQIVSRWGMVFLNGYGGAAQGVSTIK